MDEDYVSSSVRAALYGVRYMVCAGICYMARAPDHQLQSIAKTNSHDALETCHHEGPPLASNRIGDRWI